ncbi:ArsI/CadI family heavy metal resistance metalloenzyme [Nitrosomonas mobilis]|uniref:Glyoxalase/bleomycin resistance protein/dioxygenase n=1 Tax=Nitrosomonas mobilis TaxID=51642 RepID=A0A1G5SGY3_9PROT|nr:ArsI/CadI family heavy metal resistance metalloenzyme [Nitrosomonas mobilis]SCZ86456.1 Glyoxalase/bleomycin resistance protein/dioxygenase [Nitrosomonas mobilis]
MKRFHIHIAVNNLEENIRFYSALFGAGPVMSKTDYAKWMLEDPCINFAISTKSTKTGVDHVGIQVDSDDELKEIDQRLNEALLSAIEQKNAQCCYAASNKYWTVDPQGIAWEAFHSLTSIPTFGQDAEIPIKNESCCALQK